MRIACPSTLECCFECGRGCGCCSILSGSGIEIHPPAPHCRASVRPALPRRDGAGRGPRPVPDMRHRPQDAGGGPLPRAEDPPLRRLHRVRALRRPGQEPAGLRHAPPQEAPAQRGEAGAGELRQGSRSFPGSGGGGGGPAPRRQHGFSGAQD